MLTVLSQEYVDQCRYNEAIEEGKREGKLELSYEAARKMLQFNNVTASQVASCFPLLTHEDIAKLQSELKMR